MVGASSLPDQHADHPGKAPLRLHHEAAILACIVLAAAILRLFLIGDASLWLDEGYSLWFSQQSVADLWGPLAKVETNTPLYYTLLKGWTAFFGDSPIALRSLSAVFSAVTIIPVYFTGRLLVPSRAGIWIGITAACIFALQVVSIRFAAEARVYALFALAAACTCASAAAIIRQWNDQHFTRPPWQTMAPYLALGASLALLIWCHNTGLFFAAAFAGCLGVWWFFSTRCNLEVLAYLLAGGLFGLVLAAPALHTLLAYSFHQSSSFWLTPPDIVDLADILSAVLQADHGLKPVSFGLEFLLRALIAGSFMLLCLQVLLRTRTPLVRQGLAFLLGVTFLSLLMFVLVTYLAKPVLMHRVLVPVQPVWAVALSLSLFAFQEQGPNPRLQRRLGATIMAAFAFSTTLFFLNQPTFSGVEDWRGVARHIEAEGGPSRASRLITHTVGAVLLDKYMDTTGYEIITLPHAPHVPDLSAAEPGAKLPFVTSNANNHPELFSALLESGQSAWIVLRQPRRMDAIQALLIQHGLTQPVFEDAEIKLFYFPGNPAGENNAFQLTDVP